MINVAHTLLVFVVLKITVVVDSILIILKGLWKFKRIYLVNFGEYFLKKIHFKMQEFIEDLKVGYLVLIATFMLLNMEDLVTSAVKEEVSERIEFVIIVKS